MRYVWYTTAAVALLLATGAQAAPRRQAPQGLRRRAGIDAPRRSHRPVSRELDLAKLPVYPGAELTQQMSLTGDQLRSFGAEVPEKTKEALKKLVGIQVLGYRLAKNAVPKNVLAFYEPRVLSHGYRLMMKDQGGDEPGEITGVYTNPNGGLVVISVSSDEGFPELEIVSVRGSVNGLDGLGALGALEKLAPNGEKPAPEPFPTPKPNEPPATPGSNEGAPEPAASL
jgi:hypothetical protein